MQRKIKFLDLFRKCVAYYKKPLFPHEQKAPKTIAAYEARYMNVSNFMSENRLQKLPAEEFSISIVKQLYAYMLKRTGNDYAVRACEMCNYVLKWGVNEEIIKVNQVYMYQLKRSPKQEPESLQPVPMQAIINYNIVEEHLIRTLDRFAFQIRTGMAFADMFAVNYSNIIYNGQDGRYYLVYTRTKTKVKAIIPYTDEIDRVWKKYNYQMPAISNQKYNFQLKELQERLGIPQRLYSHLARKTFAMIKLNVEGYAIEEVSRMLGHKKISTTETHYAFVELSRISTAVDKFEKRTATITPSFTTWTPQLIAPPDLRSYASA